jgi:hypothetical protein
MSLMTMDFKPSMKRMKIQVESAHVGEEGLITPPLSEGLYLCNPYSFQDFDREDTSDQKDDELGRVLWNVHKNIEMENSRVSR